MTDSQFIPQMIETMRRNVSETIAELDAKHVIDCDFLAEGIKALRKRVANGDFCQANVAEPKKLKAVTLEDVDLVDMRHRVTFNAPAWLTLAQAVDLNPRAEASTQASESSNAVAVVAHPPAVESMAYNEMRAELKKLGLSTQGKKDVLMERLLAARAGLGKASASVPASAPPPPASVPASAPPASELDKENKVESPIAPAAPEVVMVEDEAVLDSSQLEEQRRAELAAAAAAQEEQALNERLQAKTSSTKDLKSRLARLVKAETPVESRPEPTMTSSGAKAEAMRPTGSFGAKAEEIARPTGSFGAKADLVRPTGSFGAVLPPPKAEALLPAIKPEPLPITRTEPLPVAKAEAPVALPTTTKTDLRPPGFKVPPVPPAPVPVSSLRDVFPKPELAKPPPPMPPRPEPAPANVAALTRPVQQAPPASSSPWQLSGVANGPMRVFGGGKGGNGIKSPSQPPAVPPRPLMGSPRTETVQYEISDKESSGSSGEDDEDDEDKPRKNVPLWAKGDELKQALERQYAGPTRPDPDEIFPEITSCEPLEEIFKEQAAGKKLKTGFRPRGSSAIWVKDGLSTKEKKDYRKAMGWER